MLNCYFRGDYQFITEIELNWLYRVTREILS